MYWYLEVLKKYAVFDGRARRREYWMFTLVNCIIFGALYIMGGIVEIAMVLYFLYLLAVLVPCIAVCVRRLHDTGRTGWWWFVGLGPVIGWIVLFVFMVLDSQPGENEYGPNPKEAVVM